jgi:hypothetical protein
MESASAWQTDPDTLHVAEDPDGEWKILREGAPTAESRHESKFSAIDAAKSIARERSAETIKIHQPDGRLAEVLDL